MAKEFQRRSAALTQPMSVTDRCTERQTDRQTEGRTELCSALLCQKKLKSKFDLGIFENNI